MKRLFFNDPRSILLVPLVLRVKEYTMVRFPALYQAYQQVKLLDRWGISGAIVETGCWKGGCGALMAHAARNSRFKRETWLFDSFEGLPEAREYDAKLIKRRNLPVQQKRDEVKSSGYLLASETDAKQAVSRLAVRERVHIIKGWFQDTLPRYKRDIGEIALLRLDGDLYESTKCALEELYDQVTPRGIIIIDDFHDFAGCRKAVYEFFVARGIAPNIKDYPYGGETYFVKPR